MTEAEALAELRRAVAADEPPALSDGELEALLLRARTRDAEGRGPADSGWTPTWHLAKAAYEGWKLKAAKAASRFDFSSDGQSLSRSQLVRNCLDMAALYARGSAVAVAVPGTYSMTTEDER